MNDRVQVHNSRRCPACDTVGRVAEFDTRSGDLQEAGLGRIRARTLECRDADCGTSWKYFD